MGTPPSELVALAAKPAKYDMQEADDANALKTLIEDELEPQRPENPIEIDLASEMEEANKPDMTLLSFLTNTF